MADTISREHLRRLLAADQIQIVDVLPAGEYQQSHIPGAINIPLKTLDQSSTQMLSHDKPIAVYCHDGL